MANGNQNKSDVRKFAAKRPSSFTSIIFTVVTGIIIFGGWMFVSKLEPKGREVAMSSIVSQIADKNYTDITIRDDYVSIDYKVKKNVNGKETTITERKFANLGPNNDFYQRLSEAGVDIKTLKNDYYKPKLAISLWDIISVIMLTAGLVIAYMMVKSLQNSGGKLMDFGQSQARLLFGKKTGINFNDVAGIDEVREELIEIVDFLKNPKKYVDIGARIPKGVLLVGAPGTGKTLLAKAVAGEAGVPFFHTSGSEFEEMLVGAGASRVRDLFKKAKRASPCIIFIDEIDAVAKKRGTVVHSGSNEQTLNQILVEMDGLEGRENVIVLAATNRPDVLDPAILRPGRFDRTVTVPMPNFEGRVAILKVHSKNKKFASDVDLDLVARKTIGYSGADLENLLNEAAIMAAKDNRKEIRNDDLMESYLKVKLGRQRKSKRTDEDLRMTAFHEAGHAVVAKFVPGSDPVEKVSIISRGQTGGVTVYVPKEDVSTMSRTALKARIASAVGGRVAEEVFTNDISTGASGDIKSATEIAKAMVKTYGMSDKLGFVQYGNMEELDYIGYDYGGQKDYSEQTAREIDSEIKGLMDEAIDRARKILKDNEAQVRKLVDLLLEKEVVDKDEFDSLFNK